MTNRTHDINLQLNTVPHLSGLSFELSGNSRCAGWNPLKQRREKWSCACRIQSKVAVASMCFKQLGQSSQCCSSFCGCANASKSWSYTSSLFRIVRSGYWKWTCLYSILGLSFQFIWMWSGPAGKTLDQDTHWIKHTHFHWEIARSDPTFVSSQEADLLVSSHPQTARCLAG